MTSPRNTSSAYQLVVRADRVLIDGAWRSAAIGVRDGVIAAIEPVDALLDTATDITLAADEVLIPGIVDTHVHVNEPGRTHWEGFATATRAAAAGGVTTIIDMPLNSLPPTTTVPALNLKREATAGQLSVDVGFWGGAIPASVGHLEPLHVAGVFGFKAFLSPSGVDEFPHLTPAQLTAALAETNAFGSIVIVHAEDPDELDAHAHPGGVNYADFVASRPDTSEALAIDTIIGAVRETGGRAHILHLSSASALPAIRAAKAEGLAITVETCPHYLTFAAEQIPDGATAFKCCPPVRGGANRELLWEALLDGTIDIVASDHSPATAQLKVGADGDFARAWGGISGLQVSLAAIATGALKRGIPLETAVGWMTAKTSAFVGLSDRGAIEVGRRGDLAAFAPEREWQVDAEDLLHRNRVSAFDGSSLTGITTRTWLAAEQVFPAAPDAPLRGQLLSRPRGR